MQSGCIKGDSRSSVLWIEKDSKKYFWDKLIDRYLITAAKHTLWSFTIEADYCPKCKKMIFDTDIVNH